MEIGPPAATVLDVPVVPQPCLRRERLVGRLRGLPEGGVGVLVAPRGFGVTVLLAQAVEGWPGPVVWLDERCGALREALDAVPSDVLADPDALLVVDDLDEDATADGEVQRLVEELPPHRVLLGMRERPMLDLSRIVGAGRLVLLEMSDLALAPEEADELVRMLAPKLHARRRAALVALAGGWVGALRGSLAATAGGTHGDPGTWLLGPGLDLLCGPSLRALDAADRDLLVTTSVLDSLTPEACDVLLDRRDSAPRLVSLHQRLVVHREGEPGPVRYEVHPLFREYLRGRLAERGRTAELRVHQLAGAWFAERGDAERAIEHLLDAGQVDRAREVLAAHAAELFEGPGAARLRTWYRRAPELAVPLEHLVLLAAAWSELLGGNVAGVAPHLAELEAAVERLVPTPAAEHPDDAAADVVGGQWLRAEVLWLRTVLDAWCGDLDQAARHVQGARDRYGEAWSRMAHQGSAVFQVRLHLWQGNVQAVRDGLEAVAARPGTAPYYRQLAIPSIHAGLAAIEGRAHRAAFLADRALEAAESVGGRLPVDDCDARLARAQARTDLGQVADTEVAAVRERAVAVGHVPYLVLAEVAGATACAARGDRAGAEDRLERARLVLRRRAVRGSLQSLVDRATVEVAVLSGDRREAVRSLARVPDGRDRTLLTVRVLAMGGWLDEATAFRSASESRPETARELVEARMLMAALRAPTRRNEAVRFLRSAAAVAVEHGMLQALRGRPDEVVALAERVAADEFDPAVATLLATLHGTSGAARTEAPSLSQGELELLERLVAAPSNQALAEDLGISINTVKTRLRRLYAKLGVRDRASAVRAAEELR